MIFRPALHLTYPFHQVGGQLLSRYGEAPCHVTGVDRRRLADNLRTDRRWIEVNRITMIKPVGKYNVYNKITRSEGTSH